MKPKDALIKDGFPGVKPGRGRLSREAKDRLEELARIHPEWNIEGYSSTPAVTKAKTVEKKKTVSEKPKSSGADIPEIHIPFPEEQFRAFERRNGKKHYRSMRSACNNCSRSLVACLCFESGGQGRIVAEDGRGSVTVYLEAV